MPSYANSRRMIPDDIVRRYAAKKTGRRQSVERSHKVRLMTIASLAVGVIVVVLVVIKLMQHSGAARSVAHTIETDLGTHTLTGLMAAERYAEDLQKSDPAIMKEGDCIGGGGEDAGPARGV